MQGFVEREQLGNERCGVHGQAIVRGGGNQHVVRAGLLNARREKRYQMILAAGRFLLCERSVKGTSTRTTSPGLWLLIEVGLIAKEVERRISD